MSLNDRISEIIAHSQITPAQFADTLEVPRSSISHITSGRNKPSLEFITKIKTKFPEISWDWLINGEGEMKIVETMATPQPDSLPDLFSLIERDDFGIDGKNQSNPTPESAISQQKPTENIVADSQPLAEKENKSVTEHIENQKQIIKRIVMFFENGRFESYEP